MKYELFSKIDEYDLWVEPQVEDVTTLYAESIIVESQCKDGNGECDICFKPLVTDYSAKTRCGRVMGAQCLQDWDDARFYESPTYPFCRKGLCGVDNVLPYRIRNMYAALRILKRI